MNKNFKKLLYLFLFLIFFNIFIFAEKKEEATKESKEESTKKEMINEEKNLPQPIKSIEIFDIPSDNGSAVKLQWDHVPGATTYLIRRELRSTNLDTTNAEIMKIYSQPTKQIMVNMAECYDSLTNKVTYVDNSIYDKIEFEYFISTVKDTLVSAPVSSGIVKGQSNWWKTSPEDILVLIFLIIFFGIIGYVVNKGKLGHIFYVRPINGLNAVDEAVGRATEMGKPMVFVPGMSGIGDIATMAALNILERIAKKAAEYDTPLYVPCRDYLVMPIAQEMVKQAYNEVGRPDAYKQENIYFISVDQFAYVAGVSGLMTREKPATNFFLGMFYAESLILTESGSSTGAIQIAGTDADTQLPFFITTCDYTLIGEEFYAASAYLSNEPILKASIKAQDYMKIILLTFIIIGTITITMKMQWFVNLFPAK